MSALVIYLPPPVPTAFVMARDDSWCITLRNSPVVLVTHCYDFASEGEAAEFAIVLRDEGKWPLQFGPGADAVRAIVDGLTDGDAP